jgi:hypothetical protein
LYFAARAFANDRRGDWIGLGLALGGALLSRMFAFALPFGLLAYALSSERERARLPGLGAALGIAFLVFAPFLAWNATHQWVTFAFSLIHRHEGESGGLRALLAFYAGQAAAYSPGIFVAVLTVVARPRNALLAWTSLPLLCLLTALALFRNAEIYWIWGPFASSCAMLGVAYVGLSERKKIVWTAAAGAPAALLSGLLLAVTLMPAASYHLAQRYVGLRLHDGGPFEIFAFEPAARDVKRIASERHAVVATDGYGLSSVLDFYAGVAPVVIGYDWQGREARSWSGRSFAESRVLFVDKVPFATRPDFQRQFAQACARTYDGGVHAYASAGAPSRNFYFTWCDGVARNGLAVLRWERSASL